MHFLWTTFHINDMEASLAFFQEIVGLPLNRRIESSGKDIAFLGSGHTQVELIVDGDDQVQSEVVSIGFKVDSLEETMALLKDKGIKIAAGPIEPNPSIAFIYVMDPNGIKVQFAEIKA